MQLKECVAQRVLNLWIAVQLDGGAGPDLIERGALACDQLREPQFPRPIEALSCGCRQRRGGSPKSPVIGEQLDDSDWSPRRRRGRQRPACQRRMRLDRHLVGRTLDDQVIHCRRKDVPASLCLVHQHSAVALVAGQQWHPCVRRQHRRRPWIGHRGAQLLDCQLGADGQLQRFVARVHLVLDRC